MLMIVCLDDPNRLLARVASRITEGGHAVLPERILARYPRTLANLAIAVRLADLAILYDSGPAEPKTHQAVVICKRNWTENKVSSLPDWVNEVLGDARPS